MSGWNGFVIMTVDKYLKTKKSKGFREVFLTGYPPAVKRVGTLSRITSQHGIGSVD